MSITDLINLIRFIIYKKKRKKKKEILNSPKLKFEFIVIIQVFRGGVKMQQFVFLLRIQVLAMFKGCSQR